jgi:hypothetical protein
MPIRWLVHRQLLARLCLVREELAVVVDQIRDSHPADAVEYAEARAAYQRLVPMGTAAFLKELIQVTAVDRRCAALLQSAHNLTRWQKFVVGCF